MPRKTEETIKPNLPPQKAVELFNRQLSFIDHLKTLRYDDPEVDKWENFTEQLIIKAFGKPHDNIGAFYSARIGGLVFVNMPDQEVQENYLKARENLRKLLEGHIEQLELFFTGTVQPQETPKNSFNSKKVFVVHGHDEVAKHEIEVFLKEIDLEPIVLHRQVDKGNTLIEKIEVNSDVAYVIVIVTPDDTVIGSGSSLNKICQEESRARQDAIFEWGYFVGKYGRERVCCVYKEGTVLPNDLSGLVYKSFRHSVEEIKYSLLRELQSAGLVK